ncbi:MAG: hypothetical protein V4525_08160 [Pseudomonadota bacterium]
MTGISSDISTIPRDIAHTFNPIISELKVEDTLDSVKQLIDDMGAIASGISGMGIVTPRVHILYYAISAALEYEKQSIIKKQNPSTQ